MHITDLGGHSGCRIILCETVDNNVFVRKISSNIEYNDRLRIQAKKQAEYKSPTIRTPRVLADGITDEGLYFFDMEYISGITLAEYMKSVEIGRVRNIVHLIVHSIVSLNIMDSYIDSVFTDKINSLKDQLDNQDNNIISIALEMLENHDWGMFNITSCHGDLTLENIIIKDNEMYLIDFLDSFYNCWILDISSLMQDVQVLWTYRFEERININTLIRLIVFRDILIDEVREISPKYCVEVYYALLLKLLRIYPYTKDKKTYSFLNEKTLSIIKLINNEEAR